MGELELARESGRRTIIAMDDGRPASRNNLSGVADKAPMSLLAEFARPPTNGPPTWRELQALGAHGVGGGPGHRAVLMNAIGQLLRIPPSAFDHGQSKLFEHGDIRLIWLLRQLASRKVAERSTKNLAPSRLGDNR